MVIVGTLNPPYLGKRTRETKSKYKKQYKKSKKQVSLYKSKNFRELKFWNGPLWVHTVSTTGSLLGISGSPTSPILIPQGTDNDQRIGRKIQITTIQFKLLFSLFAGNSHDNGWLYLVHDKQANGALPAYTDIFDSADFYSFIKLENTKRFKIMRKYQYNLDSKVAATAGGVGIPQPVGVIIEDYIKCDIPVEYTNTTGAIGGIVSGQYFLCAVSANSSSTVITGHIRTRFYD